MLTPEYLSTLPNKAVKHMILLEDELIEEIARRIRENLSTENQIEQMYLMGYDMELLEKKIIKRSGLARKEARKALAKGLEDSQAIDRSIYLKGGKHLPKITDPMILRFVEGVMDQTEGSFENLSNTLGFGSSKDFKKLRDYYVSTIDHAILELNTGFFSHDEIIYNAVTKLADSGLKNIHYESGRKYSIEAATRMNVLSGMNAITGRMSIHNADLMDQDLMQLTAHHDSRPSHAEWQGDIVSRSGRRGYLSLSDIGYGDILGFQGANCRHDWFPYFEGISVDAAEPSPYDPFTYKGKVYDAYEATQQQRYYERQIRKAERRRIGYKAAGLTEAQEEAQSKLRKLRREYKQFSKKARMRPKTERTRVTS